MAPAQDALSWRTRASSRGHETELHVLGTSARDRRVGEDAIEKAVAIHPDLVLMDIRCEGHRRCERRQENRRAARIPVVILTSYAMTRRAPRQNDRAFGTS